MGRKFSKLKDLRRKMVAPTWLVYEMCESFKLQINSVHTKSHAGKNSRTRVPFQQRKRERERRLVVKDKI